MELGMIGLGRMGTNMVRRLLRAGHQCVVYDVSADAVKKLAKEKAIGASSIDDLTVKLKAPRVTWMMVPAGVVEQTVTELANRFEHGRHYRGFCQMIDGGPEVVKHLDPIFAALAPPVDSASRTPGREKVKGSTAEHGYLHCGPNGAGHFVKMVHNGIEYGMMAAYAEGLNILRNANLGKHKGEVDAETTPIRSPELYQYDFNLTDVTEVWRRGSVIASWLLDLTAAALLEDPQLKKFEGRVSDSGEGRWTIDAAIDEGVPANVLNAALYARFASRGAAEFADKLLSAMRYEFGGHLEKPTAKTGDR